MPGLEHEAVVFAIGATEIGGAERYLELLMDAADTAGYRTSLIGRYPALASQDFVALNIGPKWSGRTLLRSALNAYAERRRYLKAIQAADPAVVHLQFKREQILLTKPLSKAEAVVWTEHGVWPSGLYGHVLGFLYRRASRHVHRIICVSEAVASSLAEEVGIARAKLTVVDNPVDLETYRPAGTDEERASARALLPGGLAESTTVLVTTSRLEQPKGIDLAIDAVAGLPDDVHLLVLGTGSEVKSLKAQASSLGLDQRVTFAGFRDDVDVLLRAADIFLLPSRASAREGSPLSLLQAVATGLPAVVTEESGVASILTDAGVIPCETTAEAIAAAIRHAAKHRSELSSKALTAAPRFSKERWAARHVELLDEARRYRP